MSDKDWAGVLSRWGNGVEDMSLQQRQSSSSKTVSVNSGEARHSSSLSSREARSGSGVLGSLNREVGSRSEDTEAAKRSGWGLKRSESQMRDRAERSTSAAASGAPRPVSRPRWSYRGSESPGKENVEAGDRCAHILVSCHVMKIDWDILAFEYLIGFYVNINHGFYGHSLWNAGILRKHD